MKKFIIFVFLIVTLIGCGSTLTTVKSSQEIDNNSGYIAGVFYLYRDPGDTDTTSYILLRNINDDKKYFINMNSDKRPIIYKIDEGTYEVLEVAVKIMEEHLGKKEIKSIRLEKSGLLLKQIEIRKGRVFYFGDIEVSKVVSDYFLSKYNIFHNDNSSTVNYLTEEMGINKNRIDSIFKN